jgi:hypothetical protein
MNNKTKVIIGVGIAALLFVFRKKLFGGGTTSQDEFAEESSPNLDPNLGPSVVDVAAPSTVSTAETAKIMAEKKSAFLAKKRQNEIEMAEKKGSFLAKKRQSEIEKVKAKLTPSVVVSPSSSSATVFSASDSPQTLRM